MRLHMAVRHFSHVVAKYTQEEDIDTILTVAVYKLMLNAS